MDGPDSNDFFRDEDETARNRAGPAAALECAPAQSRPISAIPPRRWAYGNFLLFGHAAAIGAVDGGGKGAMATVIAASIITGRPLLEERVWRTGPVAIVTYEDDEDEWQRRIAAVCLHYGLDFDAVIAGFHFIRRPGDRVSFASFGDNRSVVFPDSAQIIGHLRRIGAALLIVDPFNHAHDLDDGNSNVLIAKVAGEIARIAREADVAALVLHHLRKGSTGAPDDLMGATSLRATFRACRILQRMTPEDAEKLGMPPRQAWRYHRIAGSKENYAPPPETSAWFKLESIALGNGTAEYPEGDNLQVTVAWTPPSPFAGVTRTQIAAVFSAIRNGPGGGEFYSPDRRAKRWAGQVIAMLMNKSEDEAAAILRDWLRNKVLDREDYTSPERREDLKRVTVNEAKAAEILGPLYRQANE